MKTRDELMMEFMVVMAPEIARFVFHSDHLAPQDAAKKCAVVLKELVTSYLEKE
jgi:hypothetical protein